MKKFVKGMQKDPERVDQPEATYRDALNANLYVQKGAIVNEYGNKVVANITPSITNIIGQCPLEDGRIVLFAKDSVGDIISILSPKNQEYTVLYRNNSLNYQPSHTIEATAKIDTQGDILVYFTDNYLVKAIEPSTGISYIDDFNPPRVFNVSKQEKNLDDVTILYGVEEYNINKLDLFLNAGKIPQFDEVRIEEGGGVVSGTYHLALSYADENGNTTNYLVTSNAVHLVTTPENTIPTEAILGDPQGSQSKKSISWEVTIPEEVNYSHLRPVIIQRFGGQNQPSSEFAYQLDDVKIPEYNSKVRNILITYTGLETVASEAIEAVVIDSVRYESAKTLVQLNNRLYISNLKSRGDIGYQRFANNIKLDAVTEKVERFDPRYYDVISLNQGHSWIANDSEAFNGAFDLNSQLTNYIDTQKRDHEDISINQRSKFYSTSRKGYKDPKLFYKKKSYRRSEVYAFYISFVLKDGTETYAYHIPGREAEQLFRDNDDIFENSVIPEFAPNVPTEAFDNLEIPKTLPGAKFYQMYDTRDLLEEYNESVLTTSYWENENEFYPDSEDFSVWGTSANGTPTLNGSIKSENVRHHKMPSNKSDNWKFISDYTNALGEFIPNIYTGSDESQTFKMVEDVNLLGIKLSNIRIPKFILKQVQGYKVYYAKRTQQNKTILGQSIPVPAVFEAATATTMDTLLATQSKFNRAWYMYGSIPPEESNYLSVDRGDGNRYNAISVFGFHDFNMLKNQHTITGASHIDVQSILVMRHYRGGPNIKEDVSSNLKSFYLPEWLSSDIGNLADPEGGEVIGLTTQAMKTKAFVTSVMMASAYFPPKSLGLVSEFDMSTSEVAGLNNTNSVYVIKADSITYLPAHLNLKTTTGNEFHGVNYLYNFAGESELAVGLLSGLPMLKGWATGNNPIQSGRFSWYTPNGYLNINNSQGFNDNYVLNAGSPFTSDSDPSIGGWPATYLVNLCSLKTDVYKSFDEQQLVWTGYYKDLSAVDIDSGDGYYQGEESDKIFGGDTYIGRYSFRSTSLSYGHSKFGPFDIPFDQEDNTTAGNIVAPTFNLGTLSILTGLNINELEDAGYLNDNSDDFAENYNYWAIPEVWRRGNNSPIATIFYFFCESDDLLGFRYQGDQTLGVNVLESMFFDGSTASNVLFGSPIDDHTHMDHLLYMNNYSLNQDLRVAIPFPKKLNDVKTFPTRTIRSLDDEGAINDKYRFYQALEYKDIPRNRGDVFKLFTLGAILYIHAERSLFVTRGKQSLQLGDQTQAYVGSGNIFEQDPDEVIPTTSGYGGCDSQFTAVSTRYGQFYLNRRDRKVYMLSESIVEISSLGMERWFLDNIPFQVESLGFGLEESGFEVDAPTSDFGFVSVYDPKFKRIILTKREKVPTQAFNNLYNSNQITVQNGQFVDKRSDLPISLNNTQYFVDGGWTVSYYPEIQVWGSRHSYIPRLYASTPQEFYSLINFSDSETTQVWEHSDNHNPGNFFEEVNNFEFEYIDNTSPGAAKIFTNIYFLADVVSSDPINYKETFSKTSTGFTEYYVYNKEQISGLPTVINYLSNSRRVDKIWYINDFRDMSQTYSLANDELVTGIPNVAGDFTTGVINSSDTISMFLDEGVVNPEFVNPNKSWFEQKRLTDHYLGIRLISDNSNSNLIYLYAAGTKHRQSFR